MRGPNTPRHRELVTELFLFEELQQHFAGIVVHIAEIGSERGEFMSAELIDMRNAEDTVSGNSRCSRSIGGGIVASLPGTGAGSSPLLVMYSGK